MCELGSRNVLDIVLGRLGILQESSAVAQQALACTSHYKTHLIEVALYRSKRRYIARLEHVFGTRLDWHADAPRLRMNAPAISGLE